MAKVRVRKRGNTYSYSFDIQKSPRRMKEKGGFPTKEAAYEAGMTAFVDWKHGNIGITSERVTLNDFFRSWFANVVKKTLRPSTIRTYKQHYQRRIAPHLGAMYLQDIRPRHIDAFYRALAETGLRKSSVALTASILSTILHYAVYPSEIISDNPCRYVKLPKMDATPKIKRRVLTSAEIQTLLTDYPVSHRFHIPLILGIYAGLRIGEALGLTWQDVDLARGAIFIRRQLHQESKVCYFGLPKTATSIREILLPQKAITALHTWRKYQSEERIEDGRKYHAVYEVEGAVKLLPITDPPPAGGIRRELVATGKHGAPVNRLAYMHALQKHNTNHHSLRHTHATRLIEAGAKPVDVAARLGHASATITQDLYTHDTEAMKRETANLVNKIL